MPLHAPQQFVLDYGSKAQDLRPSTSRNTATAKHNRVATGPDEIFKRLAQFPGNVVLYGPFFRRRFPGVSGNCTEPLSGSVVPVAW